MVENFGSYLKHERELRGVPLEEIAEVTKVHIRFLEALENNEFDQLPGEVFIKGFIRSYAKVIGLDSEEMVTAYDDNVGRERREELEKAHLESEKIRSKKKNLAGVVIGGIGLVGILVMGYWGVGSLVDEGDKELSQNAPASNEVGADALPSPAIPKENDIETEGNSNQELEMEVPQEASSSAPVDSRAKPDAHAESTPAKPISKRPKPEVEKNKPVAADSKMKEKPSSPSVEAKKVEPKTSEKPLETQKDPVSPKKPVIIQQVAENLEEAESNAETLATDSKRLHLMIQVQGNSWFNVTVDDGREEDFILPGGSNRSIYGKEKFRVTIGNRRGTRIFLNGQSIDLPFGTSDVIRDFEITAKLIE